MQPLLLLNICLQSILLSQVLVLANRVCGNSFLASNNRNSWNHPFCRYICLLLPPIMVQRLPTMFNQLLTPPGHLLNTWPDLFHSNFEDFGDFGYLTLGMNSRTPCWALLSLTQNRAPVGNDNEQVAPLRRVRKYGGDYQACPMINHFYLSVMVPFYLFKNIHSIRWRGGMQQSASLYSA
jgi:hypothetical protein